MPKVNFVCSQCKGQKLTVQKQWIKYRFIDRILDWNVTTIQTAGCIEKPKESSLKWDTYCCVDCDFPINATNADELRDWLAERGMLDLRS